MTDLVDLVELPFKPNDSQCTLLKKRKKEAMLDLIPTLARSAERPVHFSD